jgi:hypothetical protein
MISPYFAATLSVRGNNLRIEHDQNALYLGGPILCAALAANGRFAAHGIRIGGGIVRVRDRAVAPWPPTLLRVLGTAR